MGKGGSRSTPESTEKLAKNLQADGLLTNSFEDIKKDWEAVETGKKEKMDSRYYDDLFRLRYFYRRQDGYKFLEDSMKDAFPSLGYHPLALFLTQKNGNNLVITLNFDSLVEDALALYTTEKPQVINHEHLTKYLDLGNTKRPLVAKLHHGLFFAPINDSSKVSEEWTKNWTDKLSHAFHTFTPVVIGYNGGDVSFMNILKQNFPSDRQIYWCTLTSPNQEHFSSEVRNFMLDSDQRFFVLIRGFDEIMLKIGQEMFRNEIGIEVIKQRNKRKNTDHEKLYKNQFENLTNASIPKSVEEISEKGIQLFWSGEHKKAIVFFDQAIHQSPENASLYFERGLLKCMLNEIKEAIEDFSKVIELDPTNASAYYNRGNMWSDLEKHDKAIEDYSKAIEIDPTDALYYCYRGKAWHEIQKYDKATIDFLKAIELKPNDSSAYEYLGTTCLRLKKYDNAIVYFTKFIEIEASITHILLQYDKDSNTFKETYSDAELNSKYTSVYRNRADAYDALNQPDLAEADRKKAAELEAKST